MLQLDSRLVQHVPEPQPDRFQMRRELVELRLGQAGEQTVLALSVA
jgi:hypothetical protein